MDISNVGNPYDYANPVSNAAIFAGREPELSHIAYVLTQSGLGNAVGYVAVHGQRAAGKTSMLNMVDPMAQQRNYLTVRLNLVPADASPLAFFTKFYEELVDRVDKAVGLTATDGSRITARLVRRIANGVVQDDNFPLEFPENLAHTRSGAPLSEMALRHDLTHFVEHTSQPIAVIIDEAQLIADSKDVLSMLRTLGMQLRGYVFILAGTTELIDRIDEVFDYLLRQFEFVKIGRFTESSEVRACMARPLEALGLTAGECFESLDSAASDLIVLTDGNPYEVQLICHTMFAQWQKGATTQMELSAATLDEVRSTLEQRRDHRDHILLDKVKQLPLKDLLALNVLCSSMSKATLSELSFANFIYPAGALPQEDIDDAKDSLIQAGIIEMRNGTITLNGSLFDHIYIRLFTLSKLSSTHHPQLVNTLSFRFLLARQLDYLVCDIVAPAPARVLKTCCLGMDPSHLEAGLAAVEKLEPGTRRSFTVKYLHEAIVKTRVPAALDITRIECSYGETTAVRWLYAADTDDYDIATDAVFIEAQRRAAERGGNIRAERTRRSLPPSPKLLNWLNETAPMDSKSDMAHFHEHNFEIAYNNGDLAAAAENLRVAYQLDPNWLRANNLAYVLLKSGNITDAANWATIATSLTGDPTSRALSLYNLAMTAVLDGTLDRANKELCNAAVELDRLQEREYSALSLLVPRLVGKTIELDEELDVNLHKAVAAALTTLAEAGRSSDSDAVIG